MIMSTRLMVAQLRSEGFVVTPGYMKYCVTEYHIPKPNLVSPMYMWNDDEVQNVRTVLKNRGKYRKPKAKA